MANRYPLIIDTGDGNKIKELPAGDNLYLRNNNITEVQNITAIGRIDAGQLFINGSSVFAQQFTELSDTPSSYEGAANAVLRVSAEGNRIVFSSLSDFGDVNIGNLELVGSAFPLTTNTGQIGTPDLNFGAMYAQDFYGNLKGRDGTLIFDADNNQIPYAALQGIPTALSEFTNDVGYQDLLGVQTQIAVAIASFNLGNTDITGSVFGDDSTLLVDGVNSVLKTNKLDQAGALNGQALVWSGLNQRWEPGVVGVDLEAFSVDTATASGSGSMTYNNITGVFTFTPPDLTTYALASSLSSYVEVATVPGLISSITLDSVTTSGATTTNNISVGELTATSIISDGLEFTGLGVVTVESGSNLVLNAANGAGNIVASGSRITNVADPQASQDAATKAYVISTLQSIAASSATYGDFQAAIAAL